ncbi:MULTISPECIES: hypothetical protein [unclassified Chryseobacterium]|uniref:hypothetical protein n=1 Tax=unclassified Chryseobacterium TaxID=2593645 RepID=UPI0028536265|nr:hypothetical protein [Chryseobacterium sp. CFS7]MDR4895120.1 hypothetical protein [Chryseobacterium sp. CFS7]
MNYIFITSFAILNKGRLKIQEEWLIEDEEDIRKILYYFRKSDFQQLVDYEVVNLKTGLASNLENGKKERFYRLLEKIADKHDKDRFEAFSSFADTGVSLEPETINYFYTKKK